MTMLTVALRVIVIMFFTLINSMMLILTMRIMVYWLEVKMLQLLIFVLLSMLVVVLIVMVIVSFKLGFGIRLLFLHLVLCIVVLL